MTTTTDTTSTTVNTTDMTSVSTDHDRHARFIDEIAARVEERITARFAKFLLLNAAALVALVASGIAAYFALATRTSTVEARITINDARIERLSNEDMDLRRQLQSQQAEVLRAISEVQKTLYQHDTPRK